MGFMKILGRILILYKETENDKEGNLLLFLKKSLNCLWFSFKKNSCVLILQKQKMNEAF